MIGISLQVAERLTERQSERAARLDAKLEQVSTAPYTVKTPAKRTPPKRRIPLLNVPRLHPNWLITRRSLLSRIISPLRLGLACAPQAAHFREA